MKRWKRLTLMCGALLLWGTIFGLAGKTALAETSYGAEDWSVRFTPDAKMESNFGMQDLDDVISGLQPGDNAIITLHLKNEHASSTDWYMTNEVLASLEDRSQNSATYGGAYTYILTYTDSAGEVTTLFSSDTVGGDITGTDAQEEGGEGLHEATDSLETFFYLDTLTTGQGGDITLEVALDGESQGNDYQDTMADLQMNFAVELTRTSTTTTEVEDEPHTPTPDVEHHITPVRTSDDSLPLPLLAAMLILGVFLMVLAVYSLKRGAKKGEEGQTDGTSV